MSRVRYSRRLTSSERWELGLFLSMLIVGCLCLTAMLNMGSIRGMFAAGVDERQTAVPPLMQEQVVSWKPEASTTPLPKAAATVEALSYAAPTLDTPAATPADPQNKPATTKAKKPAAAPAADIKVYKGEKYRFVRTLRLRVTAYAPDGRCCWPYPGTTTATGLSVKTNRGHLVAADPRLIPMHSLVSVPGYQGGAGVPVLDQGGAIKGHRLDVMLPTYDAAKEWGSRILDVKIYEPID